MTTRLFVGLMSGTSADSIDAALVSFGEGGQRLVAAQSIALTQAVKSEIHALTHPGTNEIARMGALDQQLGEAFADAVNSLLKEAGVDAADVTAIGSHGQTIRHEPAHAGGVRFTLQVGDPNVIAERTGILTIADFRRRDIACGGQGAPLAPGFHADQFLSSQPRSIINVGGIANLTCLQPGKPVLGFDTGPGNTLLDSWILQHQGKAFDEDGRWAASGTPHEGLLAHLLSHPFLHMPPPKSTGREDFNLSWLESCLTQIADAIAPEDVQATLVEFTARTIADAMRQHCAPQSEIFICGGGAHNGELLRRLRIQLPSSPVATTEVLGLHPDWVEAVAFAWLAKQHVDKLPGNLPAVTGARDAVVLGASFPARV